MEAVGQWAVCACAAAAVCTAVLMLVPNSAQEKVMKITVSCFFLICVALPLINLLPDAEADRFVPREDTLSQAADTTDELVLKEIKSRLEKNAADLLEENGCEGFEVSFSLTEQNGRITVGEIYLSLNQQDLERASGLSALFYRTYGCTPQIAVKED